MDTPVRLRLYQYAYSPFCIPIELVLRHSGISYDLVNLHTGDPSPVIQLTKGDCYTVPLLEGSFQPRSDLRQEPLGRRRGPLHRQPRAADAPLPGGGRRPAADFSPLYRKRMRVARLQGLRRLPRQLDQDRSRAGPAPASQGTEIRRRLPRGMDPQRRPPGREFSSRHPAV